MKNLYRLVPLALFSTLALAASVPYTFTAGAPAVAAEVNANFSALANAITALETRVALLEQGGGALTVADVAGTYRRLALHTTSRGGDNTSLQFYSSSGMEESTLVIAANGSWTITGLNRSSDYNAKTTQCNSVGTFATSNSGPSTSGGSGTHFHTYLHADCTPGGFVSTNAASDESISNSGTWALAGPDTFTLTPTGQAAITVYMSKAGRTGHTVEMETTSDTNTSGRSFSFSVLFKRS